MNYAPQQPEECRGDGESTLPAVPIWAEMLINDLLPEPIRRALTNTVMNVHPSDAMVALYQGFGVADLVRIIRNVDFDYVAKTTNLDTLPNVQPLKRVSDAKNVSKSDRARPALHGRRTDRL